MQLRPIANRLFVLAVQFVLAACATSVGPPFDEVSSAEDGGRLVRSTTIAAGHRVTCARVIDGTVRCWGENNHGQLGNGTTVNSSWPVTVTGLGDVAEIRVGGASCAQLRDTTVRCWGHNRAGGIGNWYAPDGDTTTARELTSLNGVAELSLGASHACARFTDDRVACWGDNSFGQLGDGDILGSSGTARRTPVMVVGLATAAEIRVGGQNGPNHSCARLDDNTVRCWGGNAQGQLGNGNTMSSSTPVVVAGLTNVAEIALGGRHTCARLMDGTVRCWGDNDYGQLGSRNISTGVRTSSTPVVVAGLTNVAQLALGVSHSCARLTDNTMRCWGNNLSGQLGDGSTTNSASPVVVTGLGNVVEITAGWRHNCARLADSSVACWGENDRGEIGDGTTTRRLSAVRVIGLGR